MSQKEDNKVQKRRTYGQGLYERLFVEYKGARIQNGKPLSLSVFHKRLMDEHRHGLRSKPPGRSIFMKKVSEMAREEGGQLMGGGRKIMYGCGHGIDEEIVRYMEQKLGYDMPTNEKCKTCQAIEKSVEDQQIKDMHVRQRLAATTDNVAVYWPRGARSRIDMCEVAKTLNVPEEMNKDVGFVRFFMGEPKTYRIFEYDKYNERVGCMDVEEEKRYVGGRHPDKFDFGSANRLSMPNDSDFGVAYWKVRDGTHDFVVMGRLGMSMEDVEELAKEETSRILDMKMTGRKDAATGVNVPNVSRTFDTRSCSPCTKESRIFLRATERTDSTVVYLNMETGRVETYKQVTNDMFMSEMAGGAKRRMLMTNSLERKCSLYEMRSRVTAMAIVRKLGLYVGEGEGIMDVLETSIHCAVEKDVQERWWDVDKTLSLWDIALLEHDCASDELRLHQPCRYHVDGNGGHCLETYGTFPKVREGMREGETSMVSHTQRTALLPLVHQGFAVENRPGVDVLHVKLTGTVHAGDNSRGVHNYSKVKGAFKKKREKRKYRNV